MPIAPFRYSPLWLPLVVCLTVGMAAAQSPLSRPLEGPVPDWVQPQQPDTAFHPPQSEVEGGAFLCLLSRQENLSAGVTYWHVIRQIVSEKGVQQYGQVSVNYAPSYQQLVFHTIRLLRDGRVIDQVDVDRMKVVHTETDLKRFLYNGLYTAYLPLTDLRAGDRIEYAYSVKGRNPVMEGNSDGFFYFNGSSPMGVVYISVMTDTAHPVSWRQYNGLPAPSVSLWQGRRLYSWHFDTRKSYEAPSGTPSWYDGAPYAQFSSIHSWGKLAEWAVADFGASEPRATRVLKRLAAGWRKQAGGDTLAYITQAVRFVQDQVRYLGVEMGIYSHRPHDPVRVLTQRYGDCKDKALLLSTLLQEGGVPAFVALVNTGYGHELRDYLPAIGLFNHAIVTYRWRDSAYWIDPTMTGQRGPVLRTATPDYGYALVVRPGEEALVPMRVPGPGSIDVLERFTVPWDNTDTAMLHVISVYRGGEADDMRDMFSAQSLREIQQSYLDYYKEIYRHVSRTDSLRYVDDPAANVFKTVEHYQLADPWQAKDSTSIKRYFSVYAKILQNRLPALADEDTKTPVTLPGPLNLHYRIQVITPERWPFRIDADWVNREAYRYRYDPFQSGDTINIDYSYNTFAGYVPARDVKQLDTDLRQIAGDMTLQLSSAGRGTGGRPVGWLAVLLSLMAAGVFSYLAWRYYRRPSAMATPGTGRPLGSWLLLLGLGVMLTPLRLVYSIGTTSLYSRLAGLSGLVLAARVFDIVANTFLLVLSVFAAILYIKRRDIFPRVYIFLLCYDLILIISSRVVLYAYLSTEMKGAFSGIGQLLIAAIIWIPYLLLSSRVKETFVCPAPVLAVAGEPEPVFPSGGDTVEEGSPHAVGLPSGEQEQSPPQSATGGTI